MTDFANIAVAIGTFLLALAAFATMLQDRKQISILYRLYALLRPIPNLRITSLNFKGNIARVNIENFSSVPGYEVGLASSFYLVYPKYYSSSEEKEELSTSLAQQMIAEGKTVYRHFQPLLKEQLIYQDIRMVPQTYVSFMLTSLNEATLLPQKSETIEVEPEFYIGTNEVLSKGQILNFEKLKEVLLQNNHTFAAINMSLVYKDKLETPMGYEPYAKFVINFKRHKTLEEARREGISFDFVALSPGEIQRKSKGVTMDYYKNVKSSQSPEVLEEIDKGYF